MVKTYTEAGVDIEKESESIDAIVKELKYRRTGLGQILDIGRHFTGLIDFGEYSLSLCTDGVGTKLLVAKGMNKWDTVGIDCIALNVNDMICVGAEPLAFVDYLALSRYDKEVVRQIGVGLNKGAEQANISIIGGELSTIPEIVKNFDLAGTCLGCVRKDEIITGAKVSPGDSIIGFRSSGIHSNGLTLARKVFEEANLSYEDNLPNDDQKVGEALLEPYEIYVRPVLELIKQFDVKGMANITGGGFRNLARMNSDVEFRIEQPFDPHPVFDSIQSLGGIDDREMYQTFNMGLGFAAVVPEEDADSSVGFLKEKTTARVVGSVEEGQGVSIPGKGLHYDRY
ncbi:MAG: phosphoribosylformylglycinamidine cyclo-ligase [Methanobacteriota archaeon]|nr:MAG: phosphoribosylformylglycinamidine cyclo-ligase [Euryarchaeota archaeon]